MNTIVNKLSYVVVIPARMASTRLPNKPLVSIYGKTMIQMTCEQVAKAVSIEKIIVATDHQEIFDHITKLGFNAMMTSETCMTGTDRVAEVAEKTNYDYYVNVQGDEPIINPDDIKKIISQISHYPNKVLNGYTSIDDYEDYISSSIPKVVFNSNGHLLYMSRSPIPGNKEGKLVQSWRQICIYSFPREVLKEFAKTKEKPTLEKIEDIEILRFIEMGFQVQMLPLSNTSIAVDTPKDLEKVKKRMNE